MDKYQSHLNDQYLLDHNLIGATTMEELKELEALAFAARAAELATKEKKWNSFSEKDFKQLHFHLFQDVYSFAGKYRTVQISKGHTRFCQTEFLNSYAKDLFEKLTNEPLWSSKEEAAKRLAYFKAELNMLHPFREGNGRTIRMFIHAFAQSQRVNWAFETMDREQYMDAMIQSVTDLQPLEHLFYETMEWE